MLLKSESARKRGPFNIEILFWPQKSKVNIYYNLKSRTNTHTHTHTNKYKEKMVNEFNTSYIQ